MATGHYTSASECESIAIEAATIPLHRPLFSRSHVLDGHFTSDPLVIAEHDYRWNSALRSILELLA